MAEFTTDIGRIIQGDLWKGQTKDKSGNPLVYKTGADAGKPRTNYFFALAIPKKPGEVHWNQTPWGAIIWNTGVAGFPAAASRQNFAWKVIDGDSPSQDDNGVPWNSKPHFPGNWVIRFSGAFAPEVGILSGGVWRVLTDPNSVKCGDYAQVKGEVEFNGDTGGKPGVYMNHKGVKFHAPGEEIKSAAAFNGAAAGFQESAAPVPTGGGAGGFAPPPAASPSYTMTAKANGLTREQFIGNGWTDAQLLEQGYMVASAPAPTQAPAAPPPAAPPPAAPPAAPVRQMTAAANGATYEQMIAAGWTDDLLVQHGMMIG